MVIATVLLNVSCGGGNEHPSAAEIAQIDAEAAAAWVAPEEGAGWEDWALAYTASSLEAALASSAAGGGSNR